MLYVNCDNYRSQIKGLVILLFFFLSSCAPTRNLVYFSDLDPQATYSEAINNQTEAKIQPDDLLSIVVTSLSPEANNLFNRGALPSIGTGPSTSGASTYAQGNAFNESYLVDRNGEIYFPVLGKIRVAGLTKAEAKDYITNKLENYLKEPIVYIRYMNFRVSVMGEVSKPATFTIPSERINILEAIGLAGDMTPYGKRETVLVIREESGMRTLARVNLNSKDIFNSPFFYLQQNDVIYVEPHKALAARTSNADRNARIAQVAISAASLLIVIISQLAL